MKYSQEPGSIATQALCKFIDKGFTLTFEKLKDGELVGNIRNSDKSEPRYTFLLDDPVVRNFIITYVAPVVAALED